MRPVSNNPAQVVIVGAGPTGLALAIELGHRSIGCIVLERQGRAGYAPRAKTTHTRTREHLRRWGIADRLSAASPLGVDYPANIIFVTRLSGPCITRFDAALNCAPQRDERYSEHSQWVPQYTLEAVMREHAQSLPGVRILFDHEFVSFVQDESGVRVLVREVSSGSVSTLQADFLVGSDGARSTVREQIGARMVGTYGLSRNYNTIFRAPGLDRAHEHGPGIMYWQINADVPSLIGPMDRDDLWYFMPINVPPGVTYTEAESVELIRRSTGIDLLYEFLSSDVWVASRLQADRYVNGRVFLAGDSCHLHPPFGGFGMNMGVADSVDLGWKLAAVLQGWGGQALLDSYETERRQAHEFVLDEAQTNHALGPDKLLREDIEDPGERGQAVRRELAELIQQHKKAEFHALGVVLGFCYRDSPVIIDDGSAATWQRSRDYVPAAIPGCLAPHRWLGDGCSLYDLFGSGFTLLVLGDVDADDVAAAEQEAAHTGTPLEVVRLADRSLVDLYEATRALIRPDQHVAWRGNQWPADGLLAMVSGRAAQQPDHRELAESKLVISTLKEQTCLASDP